jgi:hypothetical protein
LLKPPVEAAVCVDAIRVLDVEVHGVFVSPVEGDRRRPVKDEEFRHEVLKLRRADAGAPVRRRIFVLPEIPELAMVGTRVFRGHRGYLHVLLPDTP